MNNKWNNAIVTKINVAIYVKPGSGEAIHNNRPFHGLVINASPGERLYCFSDGNLLKTDKNDVFYLPKGSNYQVKSAVSGGCYAINFDLLEDPELPPFRIRFSNSASVMQLFKDAVSAFKNGNPDASLHIRRSIYDILLLLQKEKQRSYLPSAKEKLIEPAVQIIHQAFTDNSVTIRSLAASCGISEVYLRRLFLDRYGTSPKEYMINLRMEYAKRLLQSGQFSVSEVAEMCGYGDLSHFSREYSRRIGLSPKAYKNSHPVENHIVTQ